VDINSTADRVNDFWHGRISSIKIRGNR
jgi:hypothetical protein